MPYAYENFDFITRDPLFEGPEMVFNKYLQRQRLLDSVFHSETYSQIHHQDFSYHKYVTELILERRLKFSQFSDLTFHSYHRIDERAFLLEKNRYDDLFPALKSIVNDIVTLGTVHFFDYIFDQFFKIYPTFFLDFLNFNKMYKNVKMFKNYWFFFRSSIYKEICLFLLNCFIHKISFRSIRFTKLLKYFPNNISNVLFIVTNLFFIFRKVFCFFPKILSFSKKTSLVFYRNSDEVGIRKPLSIIISAKSLFYPSLRFSYTVNCPSHLALYGFIINYYKQIYNIIRNRIALENFNEKDNPFRLESFFWLKPFDLLQNVKVSVEKIRKRYNHFINSDPYLKDSVNKIHYIFPKMLKYDISSDLLIDKSKSALSNVVPIRNFYFFARNCISYVDIYNEYKLLFDDSLIHWNKMKFFFFNSSFLPLEDSKIPLSIYRNRVFNRLSRQLESKVTDANFFLKFNVQKKIIGMLMKHGFLYRTQSLLDEVFFKMKTQLGQIICSQAFVSCIMKLRPNALYVPYKVAGVWQNLFKPVHTYRRYFEGLKLFKKCVDLRFSDRLQGDVDWPYSSAMVMEWYAVLNHNIRCASLRNWYDFEELVGKFRFLTIRKRPSSLIPIDRNRYSVHRFLFNKFQDSLSDKNSSSLIGKKKKSKNYFKLFNKNVETRVSLKPFKVQDRMVSYNQLKSKYFNSTFKSDYEDYDGIRTAQKSIKKRKKSFVGKSLVKSKNNKKYKRNRMLRIKKLYGPL